MQITADDHLNKINNTVLAREPMFFDSVLRNKTFPGRLPV